MTLARRFPRRPGRSRGLQTLLRWVDREARAADSDKIRCFAMHAGVRRELGGPATSGQVDDGVRRQDQRACPCRRLLQATPTLARDAGRLGSGPVTVTPSTCWSASTPKATTNGTRGARAHRRSTTSTRCRRCTRCLRVTACGRPTSSPIRWRGIRDRPKCCARCKARRLRDRRASSCVGDAALHGRRRPAASLRVGAADRAVRRAAPLADRRDRGRRGRPARVVSIRPLRLFGRACVAARAGRLPRRLERRAALLRSAQGRPRLRRRAALAVLPRLRHATRPGSSQVLELPLSSALNRRVPHGSRWPTRARRSRTRPSACCESSAWRACMWLRPSYSSLDDMTALARRLAEDEPLLNLLFHSSEAIVGGSPYNRTPPSSTAFWIASTASSPSPPPIREPRPSPSRSFASDS